MDDLARQRAATVAVWRADAATRPAGDWADLGGLAVHTTGLPEVHWNGAHVTHAAGVQALGRASAWFAERGMPWGVLVPAELDIDPGTPFVKEQPVMLRDLRDLPQVAEVELRWDAGAEAARVQGEVFVDDLAEAFVLPKLVNPACAVVVACVGGTPAATATLVAVEGVAAVFGVATVAGRRRQGLGRAVTLAVLHEGLRRGCDLAYLNPSDLGRAVYATLGFREAPGWRIYSAFVETGAAAE